MDFLELCRRVREDSGVSGDGPTSVTGQRGILQRIVNWVKKANDEIQLHQDDWLFLHYFGTKQLVAGQSDYPLTTLGIPSLRTLARVVINGRPVSIADYRDFISTVEKDTNPQNGQPYMATLTPDKRLLFYPAPSADMPVNIQGHRNPTTLTANTDVPIIPVEYHESIVARALMFYADYEEDIYRYQRAAMEYDEWLRRMGETQLPAPRVR